VVVLDDVILEDPVDDYDYDYEFDFEKYAPGFEYDDSVEIFEEWVERGECCEMDEYCG
jgi:hypothetical protein